ncbi:Ig-like domain-containing protein [Burkholderia sp. S171]|uniref:Ig-like domain-containing protein n=1 Tax=Burkholderia sp. S171 TaxID=1641860 RepID=UPI00131C51C1|nr:Ig-like domain-containing protein [Burkholderia sp. S171]
MASEFDIEPQTGITSVDGAASGGTINNEIPLITGKTEPFATIDVYDGTTLLGVVAANGQGNWTLQLSTPLFDGIHDLSAVQAGQYGAKIATSYFPVTVEASSHSAQRYQDAPLQSNESSLFNHSPENSGLPYFPANAFRTQAAQAFMDNAEGDNNVRAVGQPDADPQAYVRQLASHPDSGKGFDMLAFQGDHQVLDLSALTDRSSLAHVPGIGGFDLGGQHNALVLSLADVLSLGEQDLFIDDGKHQLIVNGKEGDSVDLTSSHVPGLIDGDWHHHGTAEVGGVLYNVVEHSTANTELLVEHAVRVEVH